MAINWHRSKSFGPGGGPGASTKPALRGLRRGRNRFDWNRKDDLLPGMIPPLSGQTYSCQRQLCSGGPRRVIGDGTGNQVLEGLHLPAGSGGAWQQKPPLLFATCRGPEGAAAPAGRLQLPDARPGRGTESDLRRMPTDLIRYDLLVQDALRSTCARCWPTPPAPALPAIAISTSRSRPRPGVVVPGRSRPALSRRDVDHPPARVLGAVVTQDAFEVMLNFSRKPERLTVPFDAITGFTDPSVPFGFKLEPRIAEDGPTTSRGGDAGPRGEQGEPAPAAEAKRRCRAERVRRGRRRDGQGGAGFGRGEGRVDRRLPQEIASRSPMGDLVNLRRERKAANAGERAAAATEKRIVFGATKAERHKIKSEREAAERRLDAHRLPSQTARDDTSRPGPARGRRTRLEPSARGQRRLDACFVAMRFGMTRALYHTSRTENEQRRRREALPRHRGPRTAFRSRAPSGAGSRRSCRQGVSMNALAAEIDAARGDANLPSAVRRLIFEAASAARSPG